MSNLRRALEGRFAAVEARIAAACRRAGRERSAVTLVAVTKFVPDEAVALLPDLSVLDLGESRPQELWRRAPMLPAAVRWHMIGHLQRNKVERTLPLTTLIHSADSLRLLTEIDAEARRRGTPVDVLLEVNAAEDPNKHGFGLTELPGLAGEISALTGVRPRGLMCMAALDDDPETSRPAFARLRALRDELAPVLGGETFAYLSMGMSTDFEVAIEEGATHVRVGSLLFADVPGERGISA